MPGIRIGHQTLSSCTLVVELPVPMPRMQICPECTKVHENKSIHVRLDSKGQAFVSKEIWKKIKDIPTGLELLNEVDKPPMQVLGAVEKPTIHVIENKLNVATEATPFYVPGKTKYESRDKLWASIKGALTRGE